MDRTKFLGLALFVAAIAGAGIFALSRLPPALGVVAHHARAAEMVLVAGGTVPIGDDASEGDERPAFTFKARALLFDRTPVTVAQFAAFVADTGFRTDAERFGAAGVFGHDADVWSLVKGADWRLPQGPGKPAAIANHPVTQVSWRDADAFCRAYGARLPTEFEWERAARLGQTPDGHVFKWGEPPLFANPRVVNVWQGVFPVYDEGKDGYKLTSPVGAYGYAPSGLTDMAGNVWEWTGSWYGAYAGRGRVKRHVPAERVQRGGSFLCDGKSCQGFRATARSHSTPDTSLMHVGFRCVAEPDHVRPVAGRVVSLRGPSTG